MSYSNETLIISKDFLHMLSKLTKDDQAFIQGFTECNANIVERQTQRGKITLNRDKKNASMRRGNNRLNIVEDQRRSRRLISTSMAKARTINKATRIISISSSPCSTIELPYQAQDIYQYQLRAPRAGPEGSRSRRWGPLIFFNFLYIGKCC